MKYEMRGFKENIECVEKHLEFIYENLSEISEKVADIIPSFSEDVVRLRGYILLYYRIIQELKAIMNYLENNRDVELARYVYSKLENIRTNLRTIRKILHNIKNTVIDEEYKKFIQGKDINAIREGLFNYSINQSVLSLLEEIMDCRGNLYAAERHLTEFLTALYNRFIKE